MRVINDHIRDGDELLLPNYVEIESGKRRDRPNLIKALEHAKITGSTLLVAKLDRLSRDTKFLLALIDSGVDVAFCDLPHVPSGPVGRFILTQMAAVAELEAGLISQRTKAALQTAKAKGKLLGGYRGGEKVNPSLGLAERQRRAREFALRLRPVIIEAEASGATSLREIAAYLTIKGVRSRRGGRWDASKVRKLISSISKQELYQN